jgi:NAD(P)-dependent dehydrogenase (short-subunit alcohol dehydrogenase family)
MAEPGTRGRQFEPGSRLALVTGAGRRLGREMALKLARLGYAVAIHYHSSGHGAEQTRAQIQAEGGKAFTLQADLADPQQIERLFTQTDALNLPLHVLVNSASVMLKGGLEGFPLEGWNQTMDLNLRAVWLCSKLASARMPAGGVIINISDSGAGRLWSAYPAYSISKAGVELLTRLLAKTCAPHIRVNAIAPGLILPSQDMPEETWDKLVDKLPLKRPGSPAELCAALEFLLNSEYITGQTLVVDGGYQLS